jgi:hypothetical protein
VSTPPAFAVLAGFCGRCWASVTVFPSSQIMGIIFCTVFSVILVAKVHIFLVNLHSFRCSFRAIAGIYPWQPFP